MKNLNYLVITFFCFLSFTSVAQCELAVTHQSEEASGPSESDGSIKLTFEEPPVGTIELKIFKVAGQIEMVKQIKVPAQKDINIKELLPGTYFVQIRWGECEKFLGGFDGIKLDFKTNGK